MHIIITKLIRQELDCSGKMKLAEDRILGIRVVILDIGSFDITTRDDIITITGFNY